MRCIKRNTTSFLHCSISSLSQEMNDTAKTSLSVQYLTIVWILSVVQLANWEICKKSVFHKLTRDWGKQYFDIPSVCQSWFVWDPRLKISHQSDWYSVLCSCAYIYIKEQLSWNLGKNTYVKWNLDQLIFCTYSAPCLESRFSPLELLFLLDSWQSYKAPNGELNKKQTNKPTPRII